MPAQAHHRMWQRCHEIERAFNRLYIRERKERVWRGMESNIPPDMAECRNWCDAYDAATVPTPPNYPNPNTGD